MKIQTLEKSLKKDFNTKPFFSDGDLFFEIAKKRIKILKNSESVFGFAYNQGQDDSIIFNTFNQVKKHFA